MGGTRYDGPEKVPDKTVAPLVDVATESFAHSYSRVSRRAPEETKKEAEVRERRERETSAVLSLRISDFEPTQEQLLFAEQLISGSKKASYKSIAKKIHIGEKTVYNWMSDPGFRTWIAAVRMQLFFYHKPLIDRKLIELASKGSFRHMELFYELTGDLKKTVEDERLFKRSTTPMNLHEEFLEFTRRIVTIRGSLAEPPPEPQAPLAEVVQDDASGSK